MQVILELLKKIFIALQGVYTKQETDTALALKADATALTEEATRVDTRLAEHDAEIETLQRLTEENAKNIEAVSAGTQDATMLTAVANVAKWQTYAMAIQKDLDVETAMQLAQEFSRATDEYLADPTARKNWITNSATESTSPYFSVAPRRPVVDFSVNSATGGYGKGAFVSSTNVPVFLPNATICNLMLNVAAAFNQPLSLPKCSEAQSAFANTAMSAENISKTLDSLPKHTSGTHVITFTGSPGAAELTQESPSVAAAVARGWTVEL